ncbi:MAG: head GIN domain-containing protein [Gaiellaceae bacterium]
MSTGLSPTRRHGGLENVLRALAVLTTLVLAGLVVLVLVDRSANISISQGGTGSGVAATQARSLPPVTGVDLTGANNVVVRVGARQSVVVHADSNLLGRVTTQVSSGSLVIGNTPGTLNARSPMFVAVSVPSLDALTVQGSGNISVTGINSPSLTVRLPGSGTIRAAGTTARLDVAIGGSGTALLSRLTARDATASINGSGSIVLAATHSLDASISGSGTILYTGNPAQVTKSVTGSGTISGQ